jgi:hypothetical protein
VCKITKTFLNCVLHSEIPENLYSGIWVKGRTVKEGVQDTDWHFHVALKTVEVITVCAAAIDSALKHVSNECWFNNVSNQTCYWRYAFYF